MSARSSLGVIEERTVGNDNTIARAKQRLQLPESRLRPHFVKASVAGRAARTAPLVPELVKKYQFLNKYRIAFSSCANFSPCYLLRNARFLSAGCSW
jgi:hypothetical protein